MAIAGALTNLLSARNQSVHSLLGLLRFKGYPESGCSESERSLLKSRVPHCRPALSLHYGAAGAAADKFCALQHQKRSSINCSGHEKCTSENAYIGKKTRISTRSNSSSVPRTIGRLPIASANSKRSCSSRATARASEMYLEQHQQIRQQHQQIHRLQQQHMQQRLVGLQRCNAADGSDREHYRCDSRRERRV